MTEKQHFNIPLVDWINKQGIALVVIDMQKNMFEINPFCDYGKNNRHNMDYFKRSIIVAIKNVKRLLDFFRDNNLMVIYTQLGHEYKDIRDASTIQKRRFYDEHLHMSSNNSEIFNMRGFEQYEIIDEIHPLKDETIIQKSTSCAFVATKLDFILRNNSINKLIICGAATNCCVESTVRIAYDLGYLPTVVSDACIAANEDFHKNALTGLKTYYSNVMSIEEIINYFD